MTIQAQRQAQAAHLTSSRPGWLVLWSPWRQTFTGFNCRSSRCCPVIDEPTIDQLRAAMDLVDLELWRAQPNPVPLAHIPARSQGPSD
jgi:hypothetical protein